MGRDYFISMEKQTKALKTSGIITLITDFGMSDPYVAMMKGVILSINPGARLVDISHEIGAGSISQAGDLIRETFPFFPKGTVHVAVVDPGVGSDRRPIGLEADAHFFVGPDNGLFWPVIREFKGTKIYHLTENRYFRPHITPTFHGRDIFAPVASHLSSGIDLGTMGPPISDPIKLNSPTPQMKGGILYGEIMRVDNFGNLITNIHRTELTNFLGSKEPVIEVGNLTIKKLSRFYADTDVCQALALINSSDWLEIAVNLGRASEYVGLDSEKMIGTPVKVGES